MRKILNFIKREETKKQLENYKRMKQQTKKQKEDAEKFMKKHSNKHVLSPEEIERIKKRDEELFKKRELLKLKKENEIREKELKQKLIAESVAPVAKRDFNRLLKPTRAQENRINDDTIENNQNYNILKVPRKITPSWMK